MTDQSHSGLLANASSETIDVRIAAIHHAARHINLYELQGLENQTLPSVEPGAHIDVYLPNGMVRQYSLLIADAAPRSYRIGVKRDPASRGGSNYIHDELRVGSVLQISAPRNNFPLLEDAKHTVLIAGGIGITPIWCMVQRLVALARDWELYYSCRTRQDAVFLEPLSHLKKVHLHFDDEDDGRFLNISGIVASAPKSAHLYCCGPAPMLNEFEASTAHLPREQVHVEYFTLRQVPGLDKGFVVELARSGTTFFIPPGKTILEVLREAGLTLMSSCEQGLCGTCQTTVLAGIPIHRDMVLSEAERAANTTVMICCAGCESDRLVLDL